jgi:hypothetical protein
MDDIVKAALIKWPGVPACYGWLGLDARGDWYLRDEPTQLAGRFPQPKGSRIEHEKLREFIERNYLSTAEGAWFFQNGPQQVFVSLETAPWILGVHHTADGWAVHSHTGEAWPEIEDAWLDEAGRLYLSAAQGLGLVRSVDMEAAASAVEVGLWQPQDILFEDLIRRFSIQLDPQP